MRKSVIFGIAAFAALLIVAAFFLFERGGSTPPLDIGVHDDAGIPARGGAGRAGRAPADEAGEDVQPISTTRFVEAETRAARPADDDALRVVVLEEPDGLPASGVEVAWMDEPPADVAGSVLAGPPPLLADFDAAPNHTTTDAHGIAFVRSSPKLLVAARRGDVFGMRKFTSAPRGEIRVVMMPGPAVAARVVTSSGDPAPGVAVFISVSWGKGRGGDQRRVVSRSPDGLAIADHPSFHPEWLKAPALEVTARLESYPEKAGVKVPFEKLKEGPIPLTLDPTGRVFVKLIGPDGKPLASDARVSLDTVRKGKGSNNTQFRGVARAGTAEFLFVPVGAPLKVTAEAPGFDSVANQAVNELRSPGEELTVDVKLRKKQAVLVGRLVDETGSPLSQRDVRVDVVTLGNVVALSVPDRALTDAAGVLKLPIDRGLFGEGGCDLSFEIDAGSDRIERSGAVVVPSVSESDETPIGDVRLVRPDLLVSGTVVDDQDAPLADAIVSISDWQMMSFGKGLTVGGRGPNRPPSMSRFRARSDAAGAFQIPLPPRVRFKLSSMALFAELQGYVCRDRTRGVQTGAKDVKVVLTATGNIQGSLLLPDPAPVRRLELLVTRSDLLGAEGLRKQRFEDCVDSNGRFLATGILPGTVTIAIRMSGVLEPLALIQDVVVPRLGTTDDARTKDIDLQGHPALRR